MLVRNIEVLAKPFFFRNEPDKFLGNRVGVAIEKAHPLQSVHLHELLKKTRDAVRHAEVLAVGHGVLGNKDALAHPLIRKPSSFCDEVVHGTAAESSAKPGNRTEGADVIATFGDLEIRHVRWSREHTGNGRDFSGCVKRVDENVGPGFAVESYRLENAAQFIRTEDEIDFGDFLPNIL